MVNAQLMVNFKNIIVDCQMIKHKNNVFMFEKMTGKYQQ